MNMQQLVIPAKAGIQSSGNALKILDSRFHGNDEIMSFSSYYESIKFNHKNVMIHLYTFLIMLGFWLLLSGKFDLFHLSLGVLSAALVSRFSAHLLFRDRARRGRLAEAGRFLLYLPWLLKEIVKSTLQVTRLALQPTPLRRLDPRLVSFKTRLRSPAARVTLANSITLTPGTVTIRVEDDLFLVHALTAAQAAGLPGEMETRIAGIFGEG
jgi:multicomponent Na+:H+ antiporter subunit E